jgi:hypothetical protein
MIQCISHDELINDFTFKIMVTLLYSMLLVIISVSKMFCILRLKNEKNIDTVLTQTGSNSDKYQMEEVRENRLSHPQKWSKHFTLS